MITYSLAVTADGALLAGTYPYGQVLRSLDGGRSWASAVQMPGAIAVHALFRASDGVLYAGTFPEGDVFVSENGGDTWNPTANLTDPGDPTYPDATGVHAFCEQGGAIYAGTAPGGKVYRTNDRGAYWSVTGALPPLPRTGSPIVTLALGGAGGTTLLAGTSFWTGLYASANGGLSWQSRGAFFANGVQVTAVTINAPSPGAGSDLYAGLWGQGHGSAPGVFRSTDGGFTWTRIGILPKVDDAFSLVYSSRGTLYAGIGTNADQPVYRLQGSTWIPTGSLPGVRDVMAFAEGADGSLYAAGAPEGQVLANGCYPLGYLVPSAFDTGHDDARYTRASWVASGTGGTVSLRVRTATSGDMAGADP